MGAFFFFCRFVQNGSPPVGEGSARVQALRLFLGGGSRKREAKSRSLAPPTPPAPGGAMGPHGAPLGMTQSGVFGQGTWGARALCFFGSGKQEAECPRSSRHRNGKSNRGFFAHHPQTYPKEHSLFGAPGAFGAPFTQNDGPLIMQRMCGTPHSLEAEAEAGGGKQEAGS